MPSSAFGVEWLESLSPNECAAYTAGLIDADGSIVANPAHGVTVRLTQKNRRILDALNEHWGIGGVYSEGKDRHCWRWTVSNAEARPFLETLLPYLNIKFLRAIEALKNPNLTKFEAPSAV